MSPAKDPAVPSAVADTAGKPRPAAERHPPRQKRSAETEDRLLGAALRVLHRDGLDGATVPRIAAEAKLSPASLYRRFADKNDLLHLAFLRLLQTNNLHNANLLRSLPARTTLQATAEALLANLLKQYRDHSHLLRTLNRLIAADPDSAFAVEVRHRLANNLTQGAHVLLAHGKDIRHPEPERAARFAVLSAMGAIELATLDHESLWHVALPLNDKTFLAELARQMVAYLRRKP